MEFKYVKKFKPYLNEKYGYFVPTLKLDEF